MSRRTSTGPAWLIFSADVPERWSDRAITVQLVPLFPSEASDLLRGTAREPSVTAQEERILRLLGTGMTMANIARRLEVSTRSVERKVASLRDRLGVETTAELAAWFGVRRGWTGVGDPPEEPSEGTTNHE